MRKSGERHNIRPLPNELTHQWAENQTRSLWEDDPRKEPNPEYTEGIISIYSTHPNTNPTDLVGILPVIDTAIGNIPNIEDMDIDEFAANYPAMAGALFAIKQQPHPSFQGARDDVIDMLKHYFDPPSEKDYLS